MTTAGSPLRQAEELAEAGVPVFFCRADKRPACPRGFKDATLDPASVRRLWRRYSGPLIGVPTGAASGWDVLDIDPRHGGGAWWREHRRRIPATRMHRTRSGGLHVLFLHAEPVRNTAGKLGAGVDTRGEGGFIIWWPAAGYAASEAHAAPWPGWLLQALLERPKPPERLAGRLPALNGADGAQRLAERVLQRLEQAVPGTFHISVRRAGWTIGGLLHRLPFGEAEAQRRIVAAIARAGATGIAAHERTAAWGLERGQAAPLDAGGPHAG